MSELGVRCRVDPANPFDGGERPISAAGDEKIDVVLAANFVAEGVRESFDFWMRNRMIAGTITFAPFDQVFQQLLDASSRLRSAHFAVILIQLERWWPDGGRPDCSALMGTCESFIQALNTASQGAPGTSFLVVLCPPSPKRRHDRTIAGAQAKLKEDIEKIPNADIVTAIDLETLYPTEDYDSCFDSYAEELAQIPYTRLGFATLGTMIVRRLYSLRAPIRKVIAVDCDDTLWSGACGEIGPAAIEIGPGRRQLQEYLVGQSENGKLICLCSKNDASDVWAVFDQHPDMPLKRENLTAWKIDWTPKSDNLRELSLDLGLTLDSFVLIDNDAYECAMVQAACPEVLTLRTPSDETKMREFMRSIWDLDKRPATEEDRKRTIYYRQNAERAQARRTMSSLAEFLQSLDLRVEVTPLTAEDLARATQLMERTNQFNLSGIRYSQAELEAARQCPGRRCFVVRARDRFGDYGTVGLIICRPAKEILRVEVLLLSCRVLGKGIEQRVLSALAEIAQDVGAWQLEFAYRPTKKNSPLRKFLAEVGASQGQQDWTLGVERLHPTSSDEAAGASPVAESDGD